VAIVITAAAKCFSRPLAPNINEMKDRNVRRCLYLSDFITKGWERVHNGSQALDRGRWAAYALRRGLRAFAIDVATPSSRPKKQTAKFRVQPEITLGIHLPGCRRTTKHINTTKRLTPAWSGQGQRLWKCVLSGRK